MQFHVVIEGEKRGPYAGYRVIEFLRSGEVSPDALGWEAGMAEWKKLRDIPSFAEAVEAIENLPETEPEVEPSEPAVSHPRGTAATTAASALASASETRPFVRFWARSFDYMLVSAVAWQFCDVPQLPADILPWDLLKNDGSIIPEEALLGMAKIHYTALLIWHFVEGILLHIFGTTPGKAIFGMRLSSQDGVPLTLGKGLGRAFLVWAIGFGLGLFPFNLIGMGIGLFMLLFTGATFWDRQLAIQVRHTAPLTPSRILMAIGGFFLLMIISSLKFS